CRGSPLARCSAGAAPPHPMDVVRAAILRQRRLSVRGALMATRAKKTSKAVRHPQSGELPAVSERPKIDGPSLDSYPNWNPERCTLALDAYDPGTDYIDAAAPDAAQRQPDDILNAAELNQ